MHNVDMKCGHDQTMHMQIVFLNLINKMWCHMLGNMDNNGGAMILQERGVQGGFYSWVLIQPTFQK